MRVLVSVLLVVVLCLVDVIASALRHFDRVADRFEGLEERGSPDVVDYPIAVLQSGRGGEIDVAAPGEYICERISGSRQEADDCHCQHRLASRIGESRWIHRLCPFSEGL